MAGSPRRIEAATKVSLLGLVDGAAKGGWSARDACRYLEVSPRRVERWRGRLASGTSLDNAKPGGNPVHGLTPAEGNDRVASAVAMVRQPGAGSKPYSAGFVKSGCTWDCRVMRRQVVSGVGGRRAVGVLEPTGLVGPSGSAGCIGE